MHDIIDANDDNVSWNCDESCIAVWYTVSDSL